MNIKKIAGVVLTVSLVIALLVSVSLASSQNIKLFVNGKEIVTDVPPRIVDGRTLVPVRVVAEELGAKVEWDELNNKVSVTTLKQPYKFLKLNGDQTPWLYWEEDGRLYVEIHNIQEMIKSRHSQRQVYLAFSSDKIIVDNRTIELPVKMFDNFKAAPLDHIFNNTGMLEFTWDSAAGNLKLK